MQSNSPTDRRRHPRTALSMNVQSVRLDPDGGDMIDSLEMVDISRGGVGVISTRAFYRGQRVVVCLPMSEVGGRRNIYATVVNSRQGEEGHRVGLQFDNVSAASWCGVSTITAAA